MAKMIYRTEEKYRRPEIMGLLALFTGILLYKMAASIWMTGGGLGMTELIVLTLLFCLGWFAILSFKMGVRISKNSLKVKYNSIFSTRSKFSKKDIDFVQFVEIPEAALYNGMSVHFECAYKAHGLGDNSGLLIKLKDGEEVFVYSNSLYEERENLTNKLNEAGWTVK